MKESAAKQVAREIFYRECLQNWLSPYRLVSGHALTLLGEGRELPLLDECGVERDRIVSVERDHRVFRAQQDARWGVGLYYGEVADYLANQLHHNWAFHTLNLDVEGSYLTQLDRTMTSVLLFCWRNPNTVVATYSSVGRDTEAIWEGIKSLALFYCINPDATRELLRTMTCRYKAAGFEYPQRMTLRDLFWMRSHLEHSAAAALAVGAVKAHKVKLLMELGIALWDRVKAAAVQTLTFRGMCDVVDAARKDPEFERRYHHRQLPNCMLAVDRLQQLVYRAHAIPQRCYFARIARVSGINAQQWLGGLADRFCESPFEHIDKSGNRQSFGAVPAAPADPEDVVLWDRSDIYRLFKPRSVRIVPHSNALRGLTATVLSLLGRLEREAAAQSAASGAPAAADTASVLAPVGPVQAPAVLPTQVQVQPRQRKPRAVVPDTAVSSDSWINGSALTQEGRTRLRETVLRAVETAPIDVPASYLIAQVQREVPSDVPLTSIRSHVAVLRRRGEKPSVRGGRLTSYGRLRIATLVEQGMNVPEVLVHMPRSVTAQMVEEELLRQQED